MSITVEELRAKLKEVKYPGFSRDIVSFGLVDDIQVDGEAVRVQITHSIADAGVVERIRRDTLVVLKEVAGPEAELVMRDKNAGSPQGGPDHAHAAPGGGAPTPQGLPTVKHVIAVASAKGGVGKSTVATNLALALSAAGQKVGLLDADIYGPSLPIMMGIEDKPEITEDRKIIPLEKDGLKLLSIGFLVPADRAMIWRGPMVMGAVQQFLRDCLWGELDVLVVDMPPGTGDAQLTLVQTVPISGVVMVTTPQKVALMDVVRGIQMFEETNAPIIGVLENMSGFVCPSCGHEEDIFGKGGGERTSARYGVPFLGAVPIDPAIRASGDEGRPVVLAAPESAGSVAFAEAADAVVRFLQARAASAN